MTRNQKFNYSIVLYLYTIKPNFPLSIFTKICRQGGFEKLNKNEILLRITETSGFAAFYPDQPDPRKWGAWKRQVKC